eukprot:3455787-Lingulodinium_polyedra.AAC.1
MTQTRVHGMSVQVPGAAAGRRARWLQWWAWIEDRKLIRKTTCVRCAARRADTMLGGITTG